MRVSLSYLFLLVPSALAGRYNETLSLEYAKLSGAAYCSTSHVQNWDCGYKCSADITHVQVCQGSSTKSFVAHWEGKCLVVHEGTSNIKSFIADLEFLKAATVWDECDNCKVHGGFLDEWNSLKSCVMDSLEKIGCGKSDGAPLYVTGHSLGAALAGISMMSLKHFGWEIAESYNFGMPRTGDENFAKEFNQLFGDRVFRVTHHMDPVPQVPPNQIIFDWHFEHISPEIFYIGEVKDGYAECDVLSESCSAQYWNLPTDLLFIGNHLDYMDIDSSIFGCPDSPLLSSVALV